ncbi:hypothetical protein PUR29_32860 [Methylobacterium ajmalii]|uniref:Uncharacterized protein n=1 Tax=Methylobacterium ajmalii TaxID=2738439 RepID=A0ABV0A5S5_9HYPH
MPRTDGLSRFVAAVLIPFCCWWSTRRMNQSDRWIDRAYSLRAWSEQPEPQTRSEGDLPW